METPKMLHWKTRRTMMSLEGEQRKDYILGVIEKEGKVKTDDLVRRFSVSSETIRRYLEELEGERKLKKVYGGAVRINVSQDEPSHLTREVFRAEEKRRIGLAAAALIGDGDIVFIDEGTTTLQIVEHLGGKKDVTIITNSIPVLSRLILLDQKDLFHCELIFIGGHVQMRHLRVAGSIAEQMLDRLQADKAFITIDGASLRKGYTAINVDKACASRRMLEHARQGIIVADDSKIGVDCFYKIANLDEVHTFICNRDAPEEWRQQMSNHKVSWTVAPEIRQDGSSS
jgi:DeoR family transcriptional regulator, fructose operon transcriptional repressor